MQEKNNPGPTGTVLDAYERRNPFPWWRRKPPVTALQLAAAALEECRMDQLEHARLEEYHRAMSRMLREREKRLEADVQRLSGKVDTSMGM